VSEEEQPRPIEDFTSEPGWQQASAHPTITLGPPISLDVGDVQPPRTEARHLWAQELVRASLAIILLVILAVTVGWAFVGASGAAWPNYKELLQLVLPAETALLGSASGFYFGTRRN
jgi:hypothetical protein